MKAARRSRSDAGERAAVDAPARPHCVNAYWRGDNVVALRREGGQLVETTYRAEHCCFLKGDDFAQVERHLRESRHVAGIAREGAWVRVRFKGRDAIRAMTEVGGWFDRQDVMTYEADVDPVRRWLTDYDVVIDQPRRCKLDLEVDSRETIQAQISGKARILSWALVDGDKRVCGVLKGDTNADERELLEDLWFELQDYDQVLAWNGDGYDFLLLFERTKKRGLHVDPRRWLWLDHMKIYLKMNVSASESGEEKQRIGLAAVATALLGRGKFEGFNSAKSYEIWRDDPELLAQGNVEDAVLMDEIEAKTGYVKLHQTVCEACSTLPNSRGANPTNFVEGFLLKLGRARDMRFPTKWQATTGPKFAGAYVMEPTRKGITKAVHVCDFSGMYPNIIISWNMSPETIQPQRWGKERFRAGLPDDVEMPEGTCVAPYTGELFSTDKVGILPEALKILLALRAQWDEKKKTLDPSSREWQEAARRSAAYKIAANSFYGVMGNAMSRFYDARLAESVTQAGKWLILNVASAADGRGIEVFYIDTDGGFARGVGYTEFMKFVEWCNSDLLPELCARAGCVENRNSLAFEKGFETLLMITKKRYAAKISHYKGKAPAEEKFEIKGLEFKRGDIARMARQFQYKVLEQILRGQHDQQPYVDAVVEQRRHVLEDELLVEDFMLSKRLKKGVDGYARKPKKGGGYAKLPQHVRVAEQMQEEGLDVRAETRIEYVVTDAKADAGLTPVAKYDGVVDRFHLWENLVFPPTQRVLELAFPDHPWKGYLRVRPPKERARRAGVTAP